jgi:hypothetical protein
MSTVIRWKVVTALLGVVCFLLAYRVFDQGITLTYLDASEETSARHIKLLTGLVEHEWLGLTEEQVMLRLEGYIASQPLDSIVLKRDTESKVIYFEGIRFEFHDGKLVRVK